MKIYAKNNIVKILIALILIFAVIFIIVGERPRHKAEVSTQEKSPAPTPAQPVKVAPEPVAPVQTAPTTTPAKESAKSATDFAATPAPTAPNTTQTSKTTTTPEPTQDAQEELNATTDIDGKTLINSKYKNSDHSFMQKALADYNKTHKKSEKKDFTTKDAVDMNLSEQGLSTDASLLSISPKTEEKITAEEDVDSAPVKSLTQLSNPTNTEPSDINPALLKAQEIQDKYPQRYATSTVAGSKTVYAIDTSTAKVAVLMENNTYWTSLGRPETATPKPIGTYILEGAATDSAIVMDTNTAEAWRVTVDDDNIKWTVLKPFANKD